MWNGNIVSTVFCIGSNGALSFNNRRVSWDREILSDLKEVLKGYKIFVPENRRGDFGDIAERLPIEGVSHDRLKFDGVFFIEKDIDFWVKASDTMIVYNYNVEYPGDVFLDIPRKAVLVNSVEFKGNSHDRITRNNYIIF